MNTRIISRAAFVIALCGLALVVCGACIDVPSTTSRIIALVAGAVVFALASSISMACDGFEEHP